MTISPEQALEIAKILLSHGFRLSINEDNSIDFHDDAALAAFANAVLAEYLGEPVYINEYSFAMVQQGKVQSARISPKQRKDSDVALYAPRKE